MQFIPPVCYIACQSPPQSFNHHINIWLWTQLMKLPPHRYSFPPPRTSSHWGSNIPSCVPFLNTPSLPRMFFSGMDAIQPGRALLTLQRILLHPSGQIAKEAAGLTAILHCCQNTWQSFNYINTYIHTWKIQPSYLISPHKISESNKICHYHSLCDDWELSFLHGWQ